MKLKLTAAAVRHVCGPRPLNPLQKAVLEGVHRLLTHYSVVIEQASFTQEQWDGLRGG